MLASVRCSLRRNFIKTGSEKPTGKSYGMMGGKEGSLIQRKKLSFS
jgi:hypothetical protein